MAENSLGSLPAGLSEDGRRNEFKWSNRVDSSSSGVVGRQFGLRSKALPCQIRSRGFFRTPHDLPVSGQAVRLVLRVRRFRCQNQQCRQQTFVERLPEVVPRYGRRTTRLLTILNLFAAALSGQAGAHLLKQMGMGVSGDTLLRLAKRAEPSSVQAPKILGVDDFAFRRGRTYGTILVNLETHRPVDLLAERTADALIDWLKQHPGVEVISRDRSTEYARGASEGAPQTQQVADRWHLLKNLREAAERALKRMHAELVEQQKVSGHPRPLATSDGAARPKLLPPKSLVCAGKRVMRKSSPCTNKE